MQNGQSFFLLGYRWTIWGLLMVFFSVPALVACADQDSVETAATSEPVSAPAPTPVSQEPLTVQTPTPAAKQAPANRPSLAPAVEATSPDSKSRPAPSEPDLYRSIAPSVAFIQTPIVDGGVQQTVQDGKVVETDLEPDYRISGSGVLIEDGYIITSHRLVWPYGAVRVLFPDGSVFEDVPVVNSDPLSGLAILGPVDTLLTPLALADGERETVGSDLFLIVYPAANDDFPQPVMGRGNLQALWEAEHAGVSFFQADITLAEGYVPDGRAISGKPTNTDTVSGGALVNRQGELIGISVPIPHREHMSHAASASDVAPIVEWLVSGETQPKVGDRRPPSSGEQLEFTFETRDDWDRHWRGDTNYYRRFLVREPVGTLVKIEFTGHGFHRAAYLHDPQGRPVLHQRLTMGVGADAGSTTLRSAGPHFLTLHYTPEYDGESEQFGEARLRSNVRLIPLQDPDDGREVAVGETIAGNQDAPYDRDWFTIMLREGETVVISGESLTSSFQWDRMTVDIDFPTARENQKIHVEVNTDAYGGNGASSVVYRAPHTGEYFLDVSARGGYYLSVEEAPPDVGAVFIPASPTVEGEVAGPFGPMTVYESHLGKFSIQVPAGWQYGVDEQHQPFAEYYGAYGPARDELHIAFDNELIAEFGTVLDPLEVAAFFFVQWAAPNLVDDELVSREVVETPQGIRSERFVLAYSDHMIALATYYLADYKSAVGIFYSSPSEDFDKIEGLTDYSFGTFQVH